MRMTWRSWLWEYGWVFHMGCLVLLPFLPLHWFGYMDGTPFYWLFAVAALAGGALGLVTGMVHRKYPRRGDLPEWKEYEARREWERERQEYDREGAHW